MVFCQTERKNPLATLVFVEVILSQRRDWEFGVVLSFLAALNTPIHGDIHQFFNSVVEKAVSFFWSKPAAGLNSPVQQQPKKRRCSGFALPP